MRSCGKYISLVFLLIAVACSKDDYHYPSVVTDFIELETDNSCNVKLIRTDDGIEYTPDRVVSLEKSTPDSMYRVRCTYLPSDEEAKKASIYNVSATISPFPVNPDYFHDGIITDPVKITSVWQGGDYINLHLGIMTKGGSHGFHFIKTNAIKKSSGHQTQEILLYHSQGDDPEAYTRDVYLSCPLSKLNLHSGDSILFYINTYDGIQNFKFLKK